MNADRDRRKVLKMLPALAIAPGLVADEVAVSWNRASAGYVLESSTSLGSTAEWHPVLSVPSPLTGAGSISVNTTGGALFLRLSQ